MRAAGAALIAISLLLALYLLVAYFGWRSGVAARQQEQETYVQTQLARQVELARENIAQGSYQLATRRLEWVLAQAPDHAEAQTLLAEARRALNQAQQQPAPAVTAVTATPDATPLPSRTPGLIDDADAELARIRQLMRGDQWQDAITALRAFRRQFPDAQWQTTNQLLYDAYLNQGLQLVQGDRVELGLYYLDQAEELGDLPQEAQDYRVWAELYLNGIGYYGVNWNVAVPYLRDLCAAAPFYQNACDLLYDGLVAYGDQFAFVDDWCPAESLYREAQRHGNEPGLADKLNEAQENCLDATPTPAPGVITDTAPLTQTTPFNFSDTETIP
jgi:hypothetical protein